MSTILKLTLPLPNRKLSPNARPHWVVRSRLVKAHRKEAREALFELIKKLPGPFVINHYTLYPFYPTKRFWDDDNLTGSCKSYRDGWMDAAGQDDSSFRCADIIPSKDSKYPRLEVEISITLFEHEND